VPRGTEETIMTASRVAALTGPYLSGKTTLLESLLFAAGAIPRKGSVKDGNSVGDASAEARSHGNSTELTAASCSYLGDRWTLIDCPGSIELAQDSLNSLMIADIAVVVCEADPDKAITVAPLLKFLEDNSIPHLIFVNRMDTTTYRIRDILAALQQYSSRPLLLREVPVREDGVITGFVDLASERAFRYEGPGKPSALMSMPETALDREQEARQEMLESLADFDDALLEQLLEDTVPSAGEIYQSLTRDIGDDLIVPVFFGSAEMDNGIHRLWKALRHETPAVGITAGRHGIDDGDDALAQVFRTVHAAHAGKMSVARVWRGKLSDGDQMNGERVSGLFTLFGQKTEKAGTAGPGDVVGLGRMDSVQTGDLLSPGGEAGRTEDWPEPLPPLFALALRTENRQDDVKLSTALTRLSEEDPSISVEHNAETGELVLWGQGEMHLRIALERLENRFGLRVLSERARVPYRETIRGSTSQHARHKKQSGGHGQFGDVHIDIRPRQRGEGFLFRDTITGGVVPKQYIPSVEHGVTEYLQKGPLGFPVVDIEVVLTDGQYHSVDSSDAAFKAAAHQAMREGMPACKPVLLEPVMHVAISVPNAFTAKLQRLISGRRGQILGFDAREGWEGWDTVQAQIPQAEMHDMVIELRSLSHGVGSFEWRFDHLAELSGRQADEVVAAAAA
jgi:elongation factor G